MRLQNKCAWLLVAAFGLLLAGCGQDKTVIPADAPGYVNGKPVHPTIKIGKPYRIGWKKYYPKYDPNYDEVGIASWYGPNFHGKMTANGETYNQWAMTAAHPTLPMPSLVRVTNVETQQSVVVRVNDRGPFAEDRVIDLSRAAAEALGTHAKGIAKVRVEYLPEETERYIAKLQLKKPDEWQDIDVAQASSEEGARQDEPAEAQQAFDEEGMASWYGADFHGNETAYGETFDKTALTAAHPTLPQNSLVRVTSVKTQKSVVVRINDRGPFTKSRIIDVSAAAADALGIRARGTSKVRLQYLDDNSSPITAAKPALEALPPKLTPSEPSLSAQTVPSHFGYQDAKPETTTIAERGVVMEEIGYEEDAFSVLDEQPESKPSAPFVRFTNTPKPAVAPSVRPSVAQSGKHIFVRVGTFGVQENANQLAQRLQTVSPARVRQQGAQWVVELGPVFNRGIAIELKNKLQQHGIQDAVIVED